MRSPLANPPRLVALIPAAGRAQRLGRLPVSKEVYPLESGLRTSGRGRVVSDDLVESLGQAGVEVVFWIVRRGKWDVLEHHLSDPAAGRPRAAHLVTAGTTSVPHSLDLAYPFVVGADVVMGFADVRFRPVETVRRLLADRRRRRSQVLLALFPSAQPEKTDMVGLGAGGRVERFEVKPGASELRHTWILAAWGSAFTEFLHRYLASRSAAAGGELQMSEVFSAARQDGLAVEGLVFDDGRFLDIGTPEDLARAGDL